jgi:UDP-glucose 4-epimerase
MKRIMVCGGAGFLGSHFVDRLLASGHTVEVLDDLRSGSLGNVAAARRSGGQFKFQNIDITEASFGELVMLRRPDIIVNLTSFTPSSSETAGALASVSSAVSVLEAARLGEVQKVVTVLPATLLYGEVAARDVPIKEGHLSEPRTVAEVLARSVADMHTVYRDRHGVEFTVLAVGAVYGPRQRPEDSVVASFVQAHHGSRAPIVHGGGKQTRDFIYVDDVVDAMVRAIDRAGGLVVNVGSGRQVAIADLWTAVAGRSAPAPRVSAARPHDVARCALSPVRARIQLGWSPFTDLEDGLAETLRAYASRQADEAEEDGAENVDDSQ